MAPVLAFQDTGRVFLGVFALFRMTDAPGQPREELPRPAGARARLRSVRPRGGRAAVPRAPRRCRASNERGDWAEGQEFKSLFHSRRG